MNCTPGFKVVDTPACGMETVLASAPDLKILQRLYSALFFSCWQFGETLGSPGNPSQKPELGRGACLRGVPAWSPHPIPAPGTIFSEGRAGTEAIAGQWTVLYSHTWFVASICVAWGGLQMQGYWLVDIENHWYLGTMKGLWLFCERALVFDRCMLTMGCGKGWSNVPNCWMGEREFLIPFCLL